jgi:non-canonical purine NTP pyrophosphatase (RdgB/HAM1 family)
MNGPQSAQYRAVSLSVLMTGNEKKRAEFSRILGYEIEKREIHGVIEPQPDYEMMQRGDYAECSAMTARAKAKDAYLKNNGQPCFVEDTALYCDALEGLPGTLVKPHCSSDRGLKSICRDVHDPADGVKRSARAVAIVAIAAWNGSEDEPQCWLGSVEGTIAQEPRGPSVFGFDCIFIPNGANETLAQLWERSPMLKDEFSPRRLGIEELVKRPFLVRAEG